MVEMPEGFCIDATEVTRTQYDEWLSTSPSTSGQPSACSWNDSYMPACEWPPGAEGDLPVVCVDWCDALAYCSGVGKRLCGKIGGGANALEDHADATKSQWYAACSSGGTQVYPYGDVFSESACNGYDSGPGRTVPVASLAGCQSAVSGYQGVFDLSGNVWEWEDSCSGNAGATDRCRARGADFAGGVSNLRCDHDTDRDRDRQNDDLGFRCCSSP